MNGCRPVLKIYAYSKEIVRLFVTLRSTIFQDITPCSRTLIVTCFHVGFFLGLFFDPEEGGDMFLRNVG
jgi:hypothetical protein